MAQVVEYTGSTPVKTNSCLSERQRQEKEVILMDPTKLFLQAYSDNGMNPQEAETAFKGVIVRDPFTSRICDCDDCDTYG